MKFSNFRSDGLNPSAWQHMDRAVIAPGRFNPPHLGHKLVIDTLIKLGEELDAEPIVIIVDSGKYDKRNPLSGETRKEYLSKMFPNTLIKIARNPYDCIHNLAEEHKLAPVGGVTGTDRALNYKNMVSRIFGPELGQEYRAEVLHRDPDDLHSVAGISGTKLRVAAEDKDVAKVRAYTGLKDRDARRLMKLIRDAE